MVNGMRNLNIYQIKTLMLKVCPKHKMITSLNKKLGAKTMIIVMIRR